MSPDSRKVAVVYHFFAHYRGPVMRELLERGRHAYFLVGDVADPAPSGIRPWKVSAPTRFQRAPARFLPLGVLVQRGLLRLALRRDVKAIVFLGDVHYASTWVSAAVARLVGKRVLFWTIGWHREEGGLKALVRRTFYRLSHGLLLYGHFAKQEALKRGFPAERLYVVYNSLDWEAQRIARLGVLSDRISAIRAERFHSPERPLLICVTRLVAKRRLDLLFEAMVVLQRDGFPVNALLVGDGPERLRLLSYAEQHGLAVDFYGECYDEAVLAELLSAADATVAPGMVGLTAMQSLAYGTPVVTHDDPNRQAPEWEAIVPGKGGCFFRFGDSIDLARAIRECVTELGLRRPGRAHCDELISRFYNPAFQRRVIDRAVSGEPADDLFWMREASSSSEGLA